MDRFFERYSLIVLITLLIFAPVLALLSRGLEQDNAIENWLPAHSEALQVFRAFQEQFGREEAVVISWEGCTPDDVRLAFLCDRLESDLEEVQRAVTSNDLLSKMTGPPANLSSEEAERRLEGFLLGSPDPQTGKRGAGILAVLTDAASRDRPAAMAAIRRVAEQSVQLRSNELYLGGPPAVNAALDVWGKKTIDRVLIYLGLVCAVLSFVVLRSWRLAIAVLCTAGYSVLTARALVAVTGGSMNLVMVVMAPLVLVLALSGAVHLANYWREATRQGAEGALGRAWKMAWKPCLLASVTTAIGLVSLATSEILPVRDFGIYAAAGALLAVALALFALPAGVEIMGGARRAAAGMQWAGWTWLAHGLVRYRTPVTVATLLVFVTAGWGLNRLRTEVKPINYFPEHDVAGLPPSPARSYRFLEEHVAYLVPIETVIRFEPVEAGGAPALTFLERLELVREIEQRMRALPEVGACLSLADFAPEPPRQGLLRGAYELAAESLAESKAETRTFRRESADGTDRWRLSARVAALADLDYGKVVDRLKQQASDVIQARGAPVGVYAAITGLVPLSYQAQQEVLRGLMGSFGMAFVVILIVIALWMRSLSASLVTMVPNLTPVVLVFGAMAWLGLEIDIASMMTASVALGIAVDGTLHYLTWFREGLREGRSRGEAVVLAMGHCGPALVQTSLIAGLGLAMLGLSPFGPTARFGWMMGALLGAALIGDLVLLPALLAGPAGRLVERTVPFFRSARPAPLAGPHAHAARPVEHEGP